MKRVAAIMMVSASLITGPQRSIAHPPEGADLDSQTAKWYQSLYNKAGEQCCGSADCRPVAIKPHGALWKAFVDKKSFGETAPDAWVIVPDKALLYRDDNPTGRNILCWYNSQVRCLTLAPGG